MAIAMAVGVTMTVIVTGPVRLGAASVVVMVVVRVRPARHPT
jgi:hypothetical protein